MTSVRDNDAFEPDEITVLASVFEDLLHTLRLAHRADPITEFVAERIFELARMGERDPIRLRVCALESLCG